MRINMIHDAKRDVAALMKAVLAFGRRLRAERPQNAVTSAAASILGSLHRGGPMPASQLANEERLQPQSLTRIVKRLEQDGLIERQRSELDQRELIIALTDRGAKALDRELLARQQWLEKLVGDALSEEDQAALGDVAEILLKLAFHETDASM